MAEQLANHSASITFAALIAYWHQQQHAPSWQPQRDRLAVKLRSVFVGQRDQGGSNSTAPHSARGARNIVVAQCVADAIPYFSITRTCPT